MEVAIPENQLIGVYSPQDIPPVADIKAEIRRALAQPIASAPLRELVKGKRNVVFPTFFTGPLTKLLFDAPVAVEPCFMVRRLVVVVMRFPCMKISESSTLKVVFAVKVPDVLLMASFLKE